MISSLKKALAGTAAAALMLAGATPAFAQEAQSAPGALQQQMAEAKPVTDDEIETFITVTMEVQTIVQQWQPKLEEAQGTEKAATVQQEMQAELKSAVEDEGMTAERYNQIYAMASQDEALATRIQEAAES
ncbi:DUF4168 domain-containing protein [Aquisalinus flavus]|uniref:DUF4168 domain-containing protein n=1 Tax=Aquisalinus flavus TaxID=1526572 RepID=A0A8J2Y7U7_9PROT|nr:DUF4168 domain-containing protein [Aquisalinus flavus]MBD0426542.1 DUF4168 domain-containing protein [Aquisalinus flavus]UNE47909.1 DUF4168 domain-containing protein [Aquisalinus flavus]GGD07116.1 hypothetical protein GCM10011342_14920 [Aquisalinus flavus]